MDKFYKDNNLLSGKGENEKIDWITVKGNHIPIKDGESAQKAISRHFEKVGNNKYFVEKIDRNDSKILNSKIGDYANRIVRADVEHHVLIDNTGKIYEQVGKERSVGGFEDALYNNCISLHNHLEDVSFGSDDFSVYRDKVGARFICITPKYKYSLTVLKEIDKPYNYFYINGIQSNCNDEDQQHYVMRLIEREGYIEYNKILRNSRV